MKIAVDALGIHYFGGGRTATLHLLENLFAIDKENEYLVFLTEPEPTLETPMGTVTQHIAPVRNRFAVRLWAQATMPTLVRGYDLVHFTKNLGLVNVPTPTVTTMYDMTTLLHPEHFPWFDVWYWRTVQKWMLHATNRVIAISQNTANNIQRFYQIPAQQIDVIHMGLQEYLHPASRDDVTRVRAKYGLPSSFVLSVARIDPKKNLSALVRAFARFQALTGYEGKLVCVGEDYPKSPDEVFYQTIQALGLHEQVMLTGAVPDEDLAAIYSAATVVAITSVDEGFGITALEAMACGTPLITTRAGAIAEVVGEAAILIDANDLDQLTHALVMVIQQEKLCHEMRSQGIAQATNFTWTKAAQKTLNLYQEVVYG